MEQPPHPWPFWNLVLRTPRLELRPDDDAGLLELVQVAHRGIHDPGEMPFGKPWTDAEPEKMGRSMLQHNWRCRAEMSPESWALNLVIRLDGVAIGLQDINANQFALEREIFSGSWLGQRHQGMGIGSEMRAAVLLFAFDYLGAHQARSNAFPDNPASLRVSRKLGYVDDGTQREHRRGESVDTIRMVCTAQRFVRPDWKLEVDGFEACEQLLIGS